MTDWLYAGVCGLCLCAFYIKHNIYIVKLGKKPRRLAQGNGSCQYAILQILFFIRLLLSQVLFTVYILIIAIIKKNIFFRARLCVNPSVSFLFMHVRCWHISRLNLTRFYILKLIYVKSHAQERRVSPKVLGTNVLFPSFLLIFCDSDNNHP